MRLDTKLDGFHRITRIFRHRKLCMPGFVSRASRKVLEQASSSLRR